MKYLKFPVLLLIALITFSACEKDEEEVPVESTDIVAVASETSDLSILVDAVTQAGLVSALQGDGPFTVLAPTNAAFQDLLDSNPAWNSLSDIDNATLKNVLLFHVISGTVKAADLSNTYVKTQAIGPANRGISLKVNVDGAVTFNGDAMPTVTDVEASNGVVHIIDKVMLPPDVVTLALNNSNFSTLVAALTRADLMTDYVAILTGEGPFTVFAPTNDAFQALLDSNPDWNSLDDIPVSTLEAVLNYHVVSGANVQAAELSDGQEVSTLGGMLTVDLSSGAQLNTSSGQTANIIITDVQGSNGVVHAVDMVLLP